MNPFELPIRRPVATCMLLICMMVLGIVALFRLPLDAMPIVVEPEIDIEIPYPGNHPLEGLRAVAQPIEEEVATIPGLKHVDTRSRPGQVRVEAQFDWSANVDLKKVEVHEAVERARPRLPDDIEHIRIEPDLESPAGGAILQGRISAARDLSESWELLDRRIRRPLERVSGVASVELYGVEPQEVRIDIDLDALQRHGVEPGELLERLQSANVDVDLGAVRGDLLRYDVRALARFRDVEEIRQLPVGESGLRVGDLASVTLEEPVLDYGRHLDRRFAIGIDVFKEPSANTVETVDKLMARIDDIRADPRLQGITLLVWYDAAQEIRSALSGLRNAGLFGGVLAVGVLFAFLRRVRTTAVIAVAIPFSLLATCGAMYIAGSELNVLTLLGLMLGVGMLVDNAVVVLENIHRKEGQGLRPFDAARIGVREVAMAVLAATATTIIVWSWLFVADRDPMTIYMMQVALTICLAVVCSLIVSVTFIPLAAARFAPKREIEPGFLITHVVSRYRRLLAWTLRHRLVSLGGLLLLGASTLLPFSRIEKTGGEPRSQQRNVQISYEIFKPSTKEVMEEIVDEVEAAIAAQRDELRYESLYSYFNEGGFAITRVYLPRERASQEEIEELREQLQDLLPTIGGVKLTLGDREWWRRRGGSEGRVPIRLTGDDAEYLEEVAAEVEARLRDVPGVADVWGPSVRGSQEARVEVDPERARALGVSAGQVADAVGFAFRGQRLRRFESPSGELAMIVGLPEEAKPGLDSLRTLPVPGEAGSVPLESVATVSLARTPNWIRRVDRETSSVVTVEFADEELTTDEAQQRVREAMGAFPLPEGYGWDFGRWGRQRDEGLATMANGVMLALIVVVLLMAALFESFSQPVAILITLPLAFTGAFWSLWLGGFPLDVIAFMGVIILIGIVVNNGIVMVDHVNSLRRQGRERTEALLEGCGDRFRPVLMTAVTTLFGLLPLALSDFTVVGVYIDSMAVAVAGGLATSTLFTLIGLPVWYTAIEDIAVVLLQVLPRFRPSPRRATP
jgi:HAE1 family hydrophobic/amphiphilic exporter-1